MTAAINTQPGLTGSDGISWTALGSGTPVTLAPTANSTAILGANADLWTAAAGYNQDLGISVNGTIVAWKESGGNAGTFSPNAAYVQTVVALAAATSYTIKLQWKSNVSATGKTIYAAAGLGPVFSPTRLTAELVPAANLSSAASTTQYRLAGSNGVSWQDIDATNLKLTIKTTHTWVGDLKYTLSRTVGSTIVIDRPGAPASALRRRASRSRSEYRPPGISVHLARWGEQDDAA